MEFNRLEDFELAGETVLVRVDINSPLDPETGEIIDDYRIRKCSETLTELSGGGAKIVVLAHQGRPGGEDFTTLERHAGVMGDVLGVSVRYIDDLFGPSARDAISGLSTGDILLLENVRFYSEEVINRPPEEQAKTHLVRKLSPLVDLFVNDAFAAAHRSQPSLVGFGVDLPTAAGRLMEKELTGLGKARDPEHPSVYVLGGAKVSDALDLIDHVLGEKIADQVLVGGLVGQVLLASEGFDLGETNLEIIADEGFEDGIERGKKILSEHGDDILLPSDLRIEREGDAEVVRVEDLPVEYPVFDIGDETIEEYRSSIMDSKTVVANGPVGVFEKPAFAKGTNGLLKAIAETEAYTTIGGGHLVAAAREQTAVENINHVSTGGGACLNFLSGKDLPVLEVLRKAAERRR